MFPLPGRPEHQTEIPVDDAEEQAAAHDLAILIPVRRPVPLAFLAGAALSMAAGGILNAYVISFSSSSAPEFWQRVSNYLIFTTYALGALATPWDWP
jgi:hypothetical protein